MPDLSPVTISLLFLGLVALIGLMGDRIANAAGRIRRRRR